MNIEAQKLMDDIQAQWKLTDACARHDFGIWDPSLAWKRLTCQHCGCEWRVGEIGTYIRGYEAAGGNGDDILRGWNTKASNTGVQRVRLARMVMRLPAEGD